MTPPQAPDWLVWDGRCSDRAFRLLHMLLVRKAEGRGLNRLEALEVLGCSSRSLDRALAQLRALGLVPRPETLVATGGAGTPPMALDGLGATPPPPLSSSSDASSPPPLTPPPAIERSRRPGQAAAAVALWGEVDQVPVSDAEHALAEAVLDHFNLQLGTSFRAGSWRAKVIRRAREHRELNGHDHIAIVDATLREDWWEGRPPSPAIVYGSAEQFERCQAALAKRPRAERARLSADAKAAADQWAAREREAAADEPATLSNRRLAALLAGRTTTNTTTTEEDR